MRHYMYFVRCCIVVADAIRNTNFTEHPRAIFHYFLGWFIFKFVHCILVQLYLRGMPNQESNICTILYFAHAYT